MAESYKILGQKLTGELALDNSTVKEVIAYEVPANKQASISAIEITNSDVANQTYKLAFVKDSEADTAVTNINYTVGGTSQQLQQSIPQSLNKHIVVYNKTIEPGQTHEIKGGITLSAGDQIRAYSTSQDLIINVYGTEISGASLSYKILGQNTIENTVEVVS